MKYGCALAAHGGFLRQQGPLQPFEVSYGHHPPSHGTPIILTYQLIKQSINQIIRPVRHGVSKGVEDGHRPPTLQADHPRKGWKAILGVAHPQGIEGRAWRAQVKL
jgi:hypothetical protein